MPYRGTVPAMNISQRHNSNFQMLYTHGVSALSDHSRLLPQEFFT